MEGGREPVRLPDRHARVGLLRARLPSSRPSPVDDFAISFNLFNLLERVEEVGNDAEWVEGWSGVSKVPSLAVADVSFAGA